MMKFGEFPLSQIMGAILAHSIRLPMGILKKGHIITETDIKAFEKQDISHVMVAIIEEGDVGEDVAAAEISNHIAGDNITCGKAFTGRVNFYAAHAGLISIDVAAVNALNHMDEAITFATMPVNATAQKGQMVATVKIIPFAVRGESLTQLKRKIESAVIVLHPFMKQKTALVQTELRGMDKKLQEKTKIVMKHRLDGFGLSLVENYSCSHDIQALTDILRQIVTGDNDIIMIMGASAITDRKDVIPEAIVRAGGELHHYGMPVDPGNLMLVAKFQRKWILGLPGCSRSPKLNGIDLILSHIAAGRDIQRHDIMNMGVGGLLSEYIGRPQPRDLARLRNSKNRQSIKETPAKKNIAALILSAGQSKRMGKDNKLLLSYGDETVISHICRQIKGAGIDRIFAVTGHQKDDIEKEVSRHDVICFHNDLYEEGMSTSVKLGVSSLPKDVDAVVILLGDMPQITSDILRKIIDAYDPFEGRSIIVPHHKGKRGNPILWDRGFFNDFERLNGDMGAKMLLNEYSEYSVEVDVDSNGIFLDIDTLEAYQRLKQE